MSSSVSTSIDIFSAVAGGLIMIKGSKILHSLNNELSWYDDYLSLLIGGMESFQFGEVFIVLQSKQDYKNGFL